MSRFPVVPSHIRCVSRRTAHVVTSTAARLLFAAALSLSWATSPAYAQTCTMPVAWPSPMGNPAALSFSTCGHESGAPILCGGNFDNVGPNVVLRFFYDGSARHIWMSGGGPGFDPMMFVSDSMRGCADGMECLSIGGVTDPMRLDKLQRHQFYWLTVAAASIDQHGACGPVSLSSDGDLSGSDIVFLDGFD